MMSVRLLAISALCAGFGASLLSASDLSSYRGMQFGMTLAAAAKQAGANPADAKLVHQRPAVIQELVWRPQHVALADSVADPVKDGLLSFVNGELFRMVVNYDRFRIEGMTAEDMIDGISKTYGPATKPAGEIAYHSIYGEAAPVIARWEDSQYSYNLVRTGDGSSFALILFSKAMNASAQTAINESVRLDALEAPQREIDQQSKHDADERLILEKARSENKPNFRP